MISVPLNPLTMRIVGPTLRDLVVEQEKGMLSSRGHVLSIVGRYTRTKHGSCLQEVYNLIMKEISHLHKR